MKCVHMIVAAVVITTTSCGTAPRPHVEILGKVDITNRPYVEILDDNTTPRPPRVEILKEEGDE